MKATHKLAGVLLASALMFIAASCGADNASPETASAVKTVQTQAPKKAEKETAKPAEPSQAMKDAFAGAGAVVGRAATQVKEVEAKKAETPKVEKKTAETPKKVETEAKAPKKAEAPKKKTTTEKKSESRKPSKAKKSESKPEKKIVKKNEAKPEKKVSKKSSHKSEAPKKSSKKSEVKKSHKTQSHKTQAPKHKEGPKNTKPVQKEKKSTSGDESKPRKKMYIQKDGSWGYTPPKNSYKGPNGCRGMRGCVPSDPNHP